MSWRAPSLNPLYIEVNALTTRILCAAV